MNIQTLPNPAEIEAVLGLDPRSRRRKLIKRGIWALVLVAVLAAGAWWSVNRQSQTDAITYDTVAAKRADLVVTVTATGKIEPTTQVDISSEMSGVVRSVAVDANSLVKRDDVLAELDTVSLRAQLDRAKATLASAQAQIANAKATVTETDLALARAETLRQKGISTTQDFDTAQAAHDRAAAALTAAEAQAAVASADLELRAADLVKSRIVSPIDGVILKRSVEPGQTVASSLQAPVLFTIAEDLTRMQVAANVDEADIGAVKQGQKASFTVEAFPDRSFPAEIETVEYSPTTTDNVVTYTALLNVDNKELLLRPGMTATAQIVVQEVKGALTIPNSALRYAPPKVSAQQGFNLTSLFMPRMPRFEKSSTNLAANGERGIWILDNGSPKQVNVKTGASDGQMTEVLSGDLAEGAAVITAAKQGGT